MGIKDLWTIFGPHCEKKPLSEIEGKCVAVDLSCWVCEAQNIADHFVQPRMYLRNLYFRTSFLILTDVFPIFVLEGKAPVLKYQTISDRNAVQFSGSQLKKGTCQPLKDRSRFNSVLKNCKDLLQLMGMHCIQGMGEAEATCAYLNSDGVVAGCISQDSDCFAYGASVVYRNFSVSNMGGSVDVYDLQKIGKHLQIGQEKMVALALMCGCDYDTGVPGIGKDSALKFLSQFSDRQILDRIRSWKTRPDIYEEMEQIVNSKDSCTSCGHEGRVQSHAKRGCLLCGSEKGCNPNLKEARSQMKNELSMRKKALEVDGFPNEMLIDEFLVRKDPPFSFQEKWNQPNVVGFVKFAAKYLTWEESYSFAKILPLFTRWQVSHPELIGNTGGNLRGVIQPKEIKKTRNIRGVKTYQILWHDPCGCFAGLFSHGQIDKEDLEELWTTLEPIQLVEKAYPDLVQKYLDSKVKKKPVKRKKEPKQPKVCTIKSMLKKVVLNETRKNFEVELEDKLFDRSCFGDEEDDLDLSAVVEGIVSKKPAVDMEIQQLYQQAVGNAFPQHESAFFTNKLEVEDLFETSFDKSLILDGSSDSE